MLSNTPEMLEAHFGVPLTGGVLNTLNVRLDPAAIAFCLDHGGAKVLIADREFAQIVGPALAQFHGVLRGVPTYRGDGEPLMRDKSLACRNKPSRSGC